MMNFYFAMFTKQTDVNHAYSFIIAMTNNLFEIHKLHKANHHHICVCLMLHHSMRESLRFDFFLCLANNIQKLIISRLASNLAAA